jgi:hypothetical protein
MREAGGRNAAPSSAFRLLSEHAVPGLTTGEALVSLGARLTHGESMVAGDVVNTASRLQTAAPVNGILVGEATYRATERVIKYRDVPPVEAKGKAEPVPVWEVVEARSRFGADVAMEPRTPLVGRERELELLRGALARARHERSPQLVTLIGRSRADPLASGPVPPVRRRRGAVGIERDRQGARR